MVKQRNIFNPDKIDVLKDETPKQAEKRMKQEQKKESQRQILEAFSKGLKIVTKQATGTKSEAPLFGQFNAKQSNLF